jgi:mxaA protein
MTRRSTAWRHGAVLAAGCAAAAIAADDGAALTAQTIEPRAYGYQVGDLVERRIAVDVPAGLALDADSLPRPTRGAALELRAAERRARRGHEEIVLVYQVLLAPATVRTLELPVVNLRFDGTPRAQELRIDAWPVTVAPLVPVEVSPRRGLGELQPDVAPPHLDTRPARLRLTASVAALLLLLAGLAIVRRLLPWWHRRDLPFERAWHVVRALPAAPDAAAWRSACRQVHAALDATAGAVLFERDVAGFGDRRAAYAPLREDMRRFLRMSRREFFAGGARESGDAAWLVAFCRRCRDAERADPGAR